MFRFFLTCLIMTIIVNACLSSAANQQQQLRQLNRESIPGSRSSSSSSSSLTRQNSQISSCQRETAFNLAILSVSHAPGFCTINYCKLHQNEWIIHGLWPDYGNNSSPSFCCYQQFLDKSTLNPIVGKLRNQWKNLLDDRNEWNHWIHQWKKHGTCASNSKLRGQLNYFNTALQLHNQLKINDWMSRKNLNHGQSHSFNLIKKAVEDGFGKRVHFSCSNNATISSSPILSEIRFCYESQNLTRIDCPVKHRHRCMSNNNLVFIKSARN